MEETTVTTRETHRAWAAQPVKQRARVMGRARRTLAAMSKELVDAIPSGLPRSRADSYAAEILPLLAACEFLQREAAKILKPRRLGRAGLPFWLAGIETVVERVPFGVVLVIGPSNYPLFLPGVQTLQALLAGNAVVWKPGLDGRAVAQVFAAAMQAAGLPDGLLRITDESVEAVPLEMNARPDKVFFTGSTHTGRNVLRMAAETATPVVAELSGCDAVIVLPSANVERVVAALKFGMRLNGSRTCMAPRRLVLVGAGHEALIDRLCVDFAAMPAVPVTQSEPLRALIEEARQSGATICGDITGEMRPLLVLDGRPDMAIAQADIFAPILTVLRVANADAVAAIDEACPFGLTAAIFGDQREARRIGESLRVGTVLVNDLVVPTADPRASFGGRRGSGFGVTRGREGLLEMTAVRTVMVRRSRAMRHYEETGEIHEAMFHGVVKMSHGAGLHERWAGLRTMIGSAMRLKKTGEKQ